MRKKNVLGEICWCPVLLTLKTDYCENSGKVEARPDLCPANVRETRNVKNHQNHNPMEKCTSFPGEDLEVVNLEIILQAKKYCNGRKKIHAIIKCTVTGC
jgi:hypothetical protein